MNIGAEILHGLRILYDRDRNRRLLVDLQLMLVRLQVEFTRSGKLLRKVATCLRIVIHNSSRSRLVVVGRPALDKTQREGTQTSGTRRVVVDATGTGLQLMVARLVLQVTVKLALETVCTLMHGCIR